MAVDQRWKKTTTDGDAFDLDDLLHPAQAFSHPSDVVNDPDLTLNEKRAILASWASDACAVESAPGLRHAPNGGRTVGFDEVMDALRALDKEADETSRRYRRVVRRRRIFGRDRGSGKPHPPLSNMGTSSAPDIRRRPHRAPRAPGGERIRWTACDFKGLVRWSRARNILDRNQ